MENALSHSGQQAGARWRLFVCVSTVLIVWSEHLKPQSEVLRPNNGADHACCTRIRQADTGCRRNAQVTTASGNMLVPHTLLVTVDRWREWLGSMDAAATPLAV